MSINRGAVECVYPINDGHSLRLATGTYSQHGYASTPIWVGEYQHVVKLHSGMAVSYGVTRSIHPYDGTQSARNAANVELSWSF